MRREQFFRTTLPSYLVFSGAAFLVVFFVKKFVEGLIIMANMKLP